MHLSCSVPVTWQQNEHIPCATMDTKLAAFVNVSLTFPVCLPVSLLDILFASENQCFTLNKSKCKYICTVFISNFKRFQSVFALLHLLSKDKIVFLFCFSCKFVMIRYYLYWYSNVLTSFQFNWNKVKIIKLQTSFSPKYCFWYC